MHVLVIGGGGREHALCRALLHSESVTAVSAAPGSDAIDADGVACRPVALADNRALAALARDLAPDLIVIGPEAPLANGAADVLRDAGFAVFGPGRAGARIESSKAWAKAFMQRHGIPTAAAQAFDDPAEAEAYIRTLPHPPVIKADGLAAGKGVTVAADHDEAIAAVRAALVAGDFGEAGRRVVVEQRLNGPELSLLALVAGDRYHLLPPAQDHKAVFDGGRGPNTGGMGAYSPLPWLAPETLAQIERSVIAPAVRGLAAEGIDYRGVLYAGLMLTEDGPYVLEFNCRFGDPEAQAVLPRLQGDAGRYLYDVANGRLPAAPLAVDARAAVCVVLASAGYPGAFERGKPISGLEEAAAMPGVVVFHNGTRRAGDVWMTDGGRVLSVVGFGDDVADARKRAYAACDKIQFAGRHFRTDIAKVAIN